MKKSDFIFAFVRKRKARNKSDNEHEFELKSFEQNLKYGVKTKARKYIQNLKFQIPVLLNIKLIHLDRNSLRQN